MEWINCSVSMPDIDSFEDYPRNYILRCHNDGWRGDYEVFKVSAEDMRDVIKNFDWALWLKED